MEAVSSPSRLEKGSAVKREERKNPAVVREYHKWMVANRTVSKSLDAKLSQFDDLGLKTDAPHTNTPQSKVARAFNWKSADGPSHADSPPNSPTFARQSEKVAALRQEFAGTKPERLVPKEIAVAKPPRPPVPLRYPEHEAGGIINKPSFLLMERPGQLLVIALCAVKQMFKLAEQTFGVEWEWAALGPWAERADTERLKLNEIEYFESQKAFEYAYLEGTLKEHFRAVIETVKELPPGPQRTANILLLARQPDHVFNLSLESIQALTRPKEADGVPTPEELRVVWDVMVAEEPSNFQLKRVLGGYFRATDCIAIQAFLNAVNGLAETVGQHLEPKKTRDQVLEKFDFVLPHLLGFTFPQFRLIEAHRKTSAFNETLKSLGANKQQLMELLSNFTRQRTEALNADLRKKFTHHLKETLVPDSKSKSATTPKKFEYKTAVDVADNLLNQNENALATAMYELRAASQLMFKKLVNGDPRFQQAHGLNITTAPAPAVTKDTNLTQTAKVARMSTGENSTQAAQATQRVQAAPVVPQPRPPLQPVAPPPSMVMLPNLPELPIGNSSGSKPKKQ
jgi:hypothetical protein